MTDRQFTAMVRRNTAQRAEVAKTLPPDTRICLVFAHSPGDWAALSYGNGKIRTYPIYPAHDVDGAYAPLLTDKAEVIRRLQPGTHPHSTCLIPVPLARKLGFRNFADCHRGIKSDTLLCLLTGDGEEAPRALCYGDGKIRTYTPDRLDPDRTGGVPILSNLDEVVRHMSGDVNAECLIPVALAIRLGVKRERFSPEPWGVRRPDPRGAICPTARIPRYPALV